MNRAIPTHAVSIVAVVAALASPAAGAPATEVRQRFDAAVDASRQEMIEVRRDLHRHPEVSGAERRTAEIVATRLRALGLTVRTGVGGHGVVAVLAGGKPGPVVAFRADMDAVYSDAPDAVPFKSENPGVRHICGHDIHTTIGLALAEGLADVRDDLRGSVLFLFQPAEENATGARAMIADGALPSPLPEAIFAFHTAPIEVGQLITTRGTLMSWRDRVSVTLSGKGDLEAAARGLRVAVSAMATITGGQVGAPHSGDFLAVAGGPPVRQSNGDWTVNAVITTATDAASDSARRQIEERIAVLKASGVKATLTYEKKWTAGVTNDPRVTEAAMQRARLVVGEEAVSTTGIVIPAFSEDFGSFQEIVPGVMFFLGVSNREKGWFGMPHSPDYIADDAAIAVGTHTMGAILLNYL